LALLLCITECPSLPNRGNVDVATTNENLYGSIATFTCHDDFILVGDAMIYCLANKTWNGTVPSCKKKGMNRHFKSMLV